MKTLIRIAILIAAVILTTAIGSANTTVTNEVTENNNSKDQVIFKMLKAVRLKGGERLDSRLTFQNGHRIMSMVDFDESKPFCQVFFNSDEVMAKHGLIQPLTLISNEGKGVRVMPAVAKTEGLVSVQLSKSKNEAFPNEKSFTISCTLYSPHADKASLFNDAEISQILGKSFSVQSQSLADNIDFNREVAQEL